MERLTIIFDNQKVFDRLAKSNGKEFFEKLKFKKGKLLYTFDFPEKDWTGLLDKLIVHTGIYAEISWSEFPAGWIWVLKQKK